MHALRVADAITLMSIDDLQRYATGGIGAVFFLPRADKDRLGNPSAAERRDIQKFLDATEAEQMAAYARLGAAFPTLFASRVRVQCALSMIDSLINGRPCKDANYYGGPCATEAQRQAGESFLPEAREGDYKYCGRDGSWAYYPTTDRGRKLFKACGWPNGDYAGRARMLRRIAGCAARTNAIEDIANAVKKFSVAFARSALSTLKGAFTGDLEDIAMLGAIALSGGLGGPLVASLGVSAEVITAAQTGAQVYAAYQTAQNFDAREAGSQAGRESFSGIMAWSVAERTPFRLA